MTVAETIKGELQMGLRLIAYQGLALDIAPMALVEEALREDHWSAVSQSVVKDMEACRFYYSTAVKTYIRVACNGYTGKCSVEAVDETDVLETLSFEELKALGNMIDKKSVAFIRIYSDKELESAKTEDELKALNARNERMIAEAEIALRKR